MTAIVAEVRRYPVKGLAGEHLAETPVVAGRALPHDRRFAIAHGDSGIEPENPKWAFKTSFHMLMHGGDERLAALSPRFNGESGLLTISRGGQEIIQAKTTDSKGQAELGAFFADYLGESRTGRPYFLEARDFVFSNIENQVISLINLASVEDLGRSAGAAMDTRRFRGNVDVVGLEPWVERGWVGKTLRIGGLSFIVADETIRCGATTVNPTTLERDLNVPKFLQKTHGHRYCGVYLKAVTDGTLSEGDTLSVVG